MEKASSFISELYKIVLSERSAPLTPSPSACIMNLEFTAITCFIAEFARRILLAKLIFMKFTGICLCCWSGLSHRNIRSSGRSNFVAGALEFNVRAGPVGLVFRPVVGVVEFVGSGFSVTPHYKIYQRCCGKQSIALVGLGDVVIADFFSVVDLLLSLARICTGRAMLVGAIGEAL